MPPIPDKKVRLSDWLAAETDQPPYFCRDEISVVAGEAMTTGTVLMDAGQGEFEAWTPGGGDPVGFLVTDQIPGDTTAPHRAVGLMRGPATIKTSGVPWPDGVDATMIETVIIPAFAEKLIVFRKSA